MIKVGITGGIGSGKSYVCKRLGKYGITVYDCDAAAKRLIRTSPALQQQIISLVGSLDKAAMSRFLLANEANQKAMNAIVHPAVFRDFESSGMSWMESAILFESGAHQFVDKAVVVTGHCPCRLRDCERRHQRPRQPNRNHIKSNNIVNSKSQIVKNMKQTILAISGKPGLYKLVSRAKNSLIVEALDSTHKRIPAFATDRITSLADIAMFTETEDVPLMKVLASMRNLEEGKTSSVDFRKASSQELRDYFTKVLPDWDQDRVQNSHIKKLIQWYDILINAGITDFEDEMAPTEGDNIDDRKED